MTILNTLILYNNLSEVEQYCSSLFSLPHTENVYVSIVVNKIGENTPEDLLRLNKIHRNISVFIPEENLGYMNGMIFAYQKMIEERKMNYDYIIMSNTDIEYPDENFFKKFIDKQYEDDVWCIGCRRHGHRRASGRGKGRPD